MLSRNVNPKIVVKMIGRANMAITLDNHSHLLLNMHEKAAKVLREALAQPEAVRLAVRIPRPENRKLLFSHLLRVLSKVGDALSNE